MNGKQFEGVEIANISLPLKPRLAPWATLVCLGDSRIQFRGSDFFYTLRHPLFTETFHAISHLLDGQHNLEEIINSGGKEFLPTTISFLLKMLRANGVLQEGNVPLPLHFSPEKAADYDQQIQFFSHFSKEPSSVLASIHQAHIGVVGQNQLKSVITNSLLSLGIIKINDLDDSLNGNSKKCIKDITHLPEGLDFLIACHENPRDSFFKTVNEVCLKTKIRWMRAAIEGVTALLGPTFIPFQTACYSCYGRRIASNTPDLENFVAYKSQLNLGKAVNSEGYFAPLWEILAGHVTLELVKILSGFAPPTTIGRYYEIKTFNPTAMGHNVLKVPRCPVCNKKSFKLEAWDSAAIT